MEYVYAALTLNEADAEITEDNITAVLEAAGVDVEESRVKALVAALEDVDIEEAVETAAAAPAAGGASAGGASADAGGADDAGDDADEEEADADDGDDADVPDDAGDEDEEADGEGLGNLFG
ncbi:50S ribosomal protein P1 [Halonotius roseus]|uniref:Large ribosomal subunit protein P1 n=1 Tax=Halonotius roseus TaxID=2511997 RepID=A0A544QQ02_9EURY|nr:50S ribosomal protein P1 [Halonotius roseus]TQQ81520.1 50S ribosomal protein P1 [Halonotius roseus]